MRRQFALLRDRVARIWRKPIPADAAGPEQPAASNNQATDRAKQPSGYLLFAISFVACWLMAISFPLIDLFELERGTRSFSRDIYNLIIGTISPQSPLFPKASPPPNQDPAERVTVVLVDEETLDRFKTKNERTWPASARFYHQALLSIWRYRPRAVFVDMMFIDELPGSFAPFSDIAHLYQHSPKEDTPTPIPLLVMAPTYPSGRRPHQDFRTNNLPAQFAEAHNDYHSDPVKKLTPKVANLVREGVIEPVAALAALDTGILRSYGLFGLNAGDKPLKAAAVRLYEIETGQTLDRSGPPLEIFWDLRVAETNWLWLDCVKPGPIEQRVIKYANLIRPFFRAGQALFGPGALKQTCGTVQTVPLADLFQPDVDPDSKRMIENNLVLFGASVVGGDVYTVPVSDRLPGVYVHAMALENLLAFGSSYMRTTLRIGPYAIDERRIVWLFEASAIALIVSLFAFSGRGKQRQGATLWDTLLKVLFKDGELALTTSATGFLLSMFLLPTLSLAPLNWVGMGALAALTDEVREWAKVEVRVLAALRLLRAVIGHPNANKERPTEGGMS